MANTKKPCCICGRPILGYWNNPWPFSTVDTDKCCDECNNNLVIPARLIIATQKANDESSK